MDTTLILTGVACVVAAIIGGGVKLLQVEVRVFDSIKRQVMLGLFGAGLIVAGLLAGGHLRMPAPAPRQPEPTASPAADPTPAPAPAAMKPSEPRPAASDEAPPAATAPAESLCDTLASRGAAQWRRNYLQPTEAGTYHIFVETLGAEDDEQAARVAAERWARRHPDLAFDPLSTESVASGNPRWSIVAASGLRRQTAETVARYLRTCGVAPDAYTYQQDVGPAGF